jgi:hypothetical protein
MECFNQKQIFKQTKLNNPVRNPDTNEVTTINELDKKGLIKYESWEDTTRKRNGERKSITRYSAIFIPSITENGNEAWDISKTAFLSKTNKKLLKDQFGQNKMKCFEQKKYYSTNKEFWKDLTKSKKIELIKRTNPDMREELLDKYSKMTWNKIADDRINEGANNLSGFVSFKRIEYNNLGLK